MQRTFEPSLMGKSRWPIDVQEHALVAARSADPRAEESFLEYIKALYAGGPPDLIVSVGAPSAAFFQRRRKDLFPPPQLYSLYWKTVASSTRK